jgi:aryl-alcohol dehydrogenase-like predicted oxidoreductase
MGKYSKETTFEILDFFYTSGGNFVDTASNYQDEQSERWVGEWMATRKNHHQMVISTKFGTNYKNHQGFDPHINANFGTHSLKCLHLSVQDYSKNLVPRISIFSLCMQEAIPGRHLQR